MAERFSTNTYSGNTAVATAANTTILFIYNSIATPTRRGAIYDVVLSCKDSPADQTARFRLARITAIGTGGTAVTPANVDGAGPAGELASKMGTYTGEPTYAAADLLLISLNQRATFRWVAAPGSELKSVATQNNGISLRCAATSGSQTADATLLFEE